MAARHFHANGHGHAHALRRHNPIPEEHLSLEQPLNDAAAPAVMARASNADEGVAGPDSSTLAIALGVAIPVVLALGALLYFHRRSVQRQKREDMMADDKYKSMDFGLGDVPTGGKSGKRRSAFFGREKEPGHKTQLSMDMNLSSPYLLPPTLQHSRESLAKSLGKSEDPYRHVNDYTSDVSSLRSVPKSLDRGSSLYNSRTRSSVDQDGRRPPPRQNSLPQSPLAVMPSAHQSIPEEGMPPPPPSKEGFRFNDDDTTQPQIAPAVFPEPPTIQEPPMAATRDSSKMPQVVSRPMSEESVQPQQAYVGAVRDSQQSGQSMGSAGAPQRPSRNDSMPVIEASMAEDYNDQAQYLVVDNDPAQHYNDQPYPQSAGLGVPGQDNKRLSVGMRPLPPDEFLESEDPEFRANRIRSFYKEYFEDSVRQDSGKPPPVPQQAEYYEDYDAQYLGDAAYFDPETNAFVMPYAEPVTRRAMTPPPNSRRPMPGPRQRGPPRGPHGMPMPGGPHGGRPRAGSTMSGGRWGPMSPRPGSSASNPRFGGKPRKPMPPPADLNTLPTPSKLKDDSFAIMNAMDFAPPPTLRDQAAGRSQSPLGERRPYHLATPVHSPLVGSYDETAALPSPHLLRKSGTFTALDFAPPKRFKDPETMSDAGSIRSNNSGISSKNAFAIRNGAGRVSRLPGDTVFTQASMGNELKPQWGMRP